MKHSMKKVLAASLYLLIMSAPVFAQASDVVSFPTVTYGAVDGTNTPIPQGDPRINVNGTFNVTCTGCSYVPSWTPGQATYTTRAISSNNAVSGNTNTASADGILLTNTNGAATAVTSSGVVTTGTIAANTVVSRTLVTEDSHGVIYANVGDTLTALTTNVAANTTDIRALYSLYGAQQNQISSLNSRMNRVYGGVAGAMAYEVPQVDAGKTIGFSLTYADFQGFSALAAMTKIRITDNWAVTGGASYGEYGAYGVKFGVHWQH